MLFRNWKQPRLYLCLIHTEVAVSFNHIFLFISAPQSLNTLTQESADDEKVEVDSAVIRYPERAPSECSS